VTILLIEKSKIVWVRPSGSPAGFELSQVVIDALVL
jgi:hypothetical protein